MLLVNFAESDRAGANWIIVVRRECEFFSFVCRYAKIVERVTVLNTAYGYCHSMQV